MKITPACIFAVGLTALTLPSLPAATGIENVPGAERRLDRPGLKHRRPALRAQLARRLNLTADQKTQLKAQRQQTAEALRGIRADTSLSPEQKKAKARTTVQTARAQMRSLLTPEQHAKADRIRERLKSRGGRPGLRR